MKRLIAISVVFALVAGAVFAVDVTGTVFGRVDVLRGDTAEGSDITAGGGMTRIRFDGSGEAGDGAFGGYIRAQGDSFPIDSANAWWKPLDQFKLIIGNNTDGFWGKEGVTGWGFNQMPYDSGVAFNPGTWFGTGWSSSPYAGGAYMCSRYTFFEGMVEYGALLEIKPLDMLGVNIAIPFIPMDGAKAADVFQNAIAQIDLNFDFGNIAITYDGGSVASRTVSSVGSDGALYAYFGGSFGDLGLDVGVSYRLTGDNDVAQPMGVGVGVKYATESFGIKFKTTAALAGDDETTYINVAILPFFTLSDNLAAFVNVGLGMTMPSGGDTTIGWYFNPYLRVGAEWGPSFYAGIQVNSDGTGDKKIINWSVPVALMVSF